MHLSITGKSCVKEEVLNEAAEWLGTKLMGPRLNKNIGVEINFKGDLLKKNGVYGLTYKADSASLPREFDIDLYSRHGSQNILQNLCHEMTHVEQLARGRLKDNDSPRRKNKIWMGQEYDESVVDYWDLPWEIEAHGRERGLYLRLMDHFDSIGM